jgi:hypothetical protein
MPALTSRDAGGGGALDVGGGGVPAVRLRNEGGKGGGRHVPIGYPVVVICGHARLPRYQNGGTHNGYV